MSFVHEQSGFDQFIRQVSESVGVARAQVEKDYWITHVLWALHASGLEIWFKGGTSLSKGFGIIQRFSEDLDLRLAPGTAAGIPPEPSWRGEKPSHARARADWFDALARSIPVPGCALSINAAFEDDRARSVVIDVTYPGAFIPELGPVIRPWVRLEIGVSRVSPSVLRPITSWIHEALERAGLLAAVTDNRPPPVRCVHPLVTLLEKLDALSRRWPREDLTAASFVRHYEDAARIVQTLPMLPTLETTPAALAAEMLTARQIRELPRLDHPAFTLVPGARSEEVRVAYEAIAPFFWGPRLTLDAAAAELCGWIQRSL